MQTGYCVIIPTTLDRQLASPIQTSDDCVGKLRRRALPSAELPSRVGAREGHAEVTGERPSACEIIPTGRREAGGGGVVAG